MNKTLRFDALPILKTDHLILRPITMDDAADIFSYASDPEVSKLLIWDASTSIEQTKEIIAEWLSLYAQNKISPWGIVDKKSRKVIGTIEARITHESSTQAELGYCLSRDFWGKGLMGEATLAVINYLFTHTIIDEISAFCRVDNMQSQRVLEKLGMVKDQGNGKRELMKGKWVDLDRWVLRKLVA